MGHENVINLSSFTVSEEQLQLLNKGLTFVPSKPIYKNTEGHLATRYDIQQYHRRLKLTAFFKHTNRAVRTPFVQASTWSPPDVNLPPELLKLITDDLDYVDTHSSLKTTQNLTKTETLALKELMKNRDIVIKPADKGNAVVILDRSQYLWEGYRQLGDKN